MKEIFPGVFSEGRELFTRNYVPGVKVYGEKLVSKDEMELRMWDPTRSKLAAAILNGMDNPLKEGDTVLYLGASTGTTPSHISDIVGINGMMYAVEFAERVFRSLLDLSEKRKNIAPLFADARKTEMYRWVEDVDIVYCDIADPQETEIAIRNGIFLKEGGYLMIAIKSQSIDVTKKPEQVYKEEKEKLEKAGFKVLQLIDIEPYQEKHGFILARR
ncbi:fibrillarin-like rRNA/tRNA 2'-O-methyltransferase [Candidatus Woesearchaeota archaeon]|nr:fibrillarin-like rRNA/tRNA 2'-O-methyltransferase [Candidatus Woesearchaeota archaeon]